MSKLKRQAFDEALRRRAQGERFEVEADVDLALRRTMEHGAIAKKSTVKAAPRKRQWLVPAMAVVIAGIALGVVFARPPQDLLRGGALPEETSGKLEATVPLAKREQKQEPEVQANLRAIYDWACAEFTLTNDTEDIWLLELAANADGVALETADGLFWLEPGASCMARATWIPGQKLGVFQEKVLMNWSCAFYRVTADVLHWMDGEWLEPGQEGYEAQQELIEDAYANGALILAPGDWKNGMAGEMALALPGSFYGEHANITELEYYAEQGMLEKSQIERNSRQEVPCSPEFVATDAPLDIKICEGYVKRLMRVDIGPEHIYCVVDRVFETEEAASEFLGSPNPLGDIVMKGGGPISHDVLRANELDVQGIDRSWIGSPWHDSAGRWHVTNECLCYPVSGLKSGDVLTFQAGAADREALSYVVP